MKEKVSDLNILYHKTVRVVGVTFGKHPKNINKIIKNGLSYHLLKKYKGIKDKELIKSELNLKEFNHECLGDVILKTYMFEGSEAILVLINDFDDNYLEVGNIPKSEVANLLPLLEQDVKIDAYLTGGNIKNVLNNKIEIDNLNIGISLDIIIKEKKEF